MWESDLKKVVFHPPESIIFQPSMTRQKVVFEITNNESVDILVKWKSTRPGVYHTVPTYSIILSGEKEKVELVCKGIAKESCSRRSRDRFTIVVVPIATTNLDASTIWKDFECRKNLVIGKMVKKHVFILYAGVNDEVDFSKAVPGEPNRLEFDPNKDGVNMEEEHHTSDKNDENLKTTRPAGQFTCIFIPIGATSTESTAPL